MADILGSIILNRYRVDEFVGKGGMADVYKVWDNQRAADLAMKVLHADLAEDKVFLRRFKREAQTLSKLQHPNIVRFYGLEQTDDFSFILMDYVEGTTLRKEIYRAKSAFTLERVLEIMKPVCSALHYAHAQGIAHCDIKPANIMLHKNGSVLLSDFGIARMTEAATATMVGAGTPAYMSPEQARGADPSPQTDIYALGVVLYEMLTGGERPFTGEHARVTGSTSEKIRWEQIYTPPPPPRSLNPELSPALEAVILKCLEKDPALRYSTALDVLNALTQAAMSAAPVQPLPKAPVEPLPQAPEAPIPPIAPPPPTGPISEKQPPTQLPPPQKAPVNWWMWGFLGLGLTLVCLISIIGLFMFSSAQQASTAATAVEEAHLIAAATGKANVEATQASADAAATQASADASATQASADATATEQANIAAASPTPKPAICPPDSAESGKVTVRWFIGLGTGTDPSQVTAEQSVVDDFNASQDKIQLTTEIIPFASARDTLLTEIAAGNGPDIVGPVGWNGAMSFYGHWRDLSDCIAGFDTSEFDPTLVASYKSSEGQIGLPFAVYPSIIFYNTALFDRAGLAYPPARYGDKYQLDGQMVDWDWETTVKTVAQRLTIDSNGRNATQSGFNKNRIAQYGFSYNFESQPSYIGAFWANGSFTAADGRTAQIPPAWLDSWKWFYDGVWGAQPFIPNGQVSGSPGFGNGNVFNSGKIAMIDQPIWYMCCMNDVKTWEAGAMPGYRGVVNGRVDADTFRILKSSRHPNAAFQVLTYLVTTGVQKLIIGSNAMPAAYGALPARRKDFDAWLSAKKVAFPWVRNWQLISDGLSYPDSPSAEAWMPNYNEAWTAVGAAYSKWLNTGGLDIYAEANALQRQLQAIFDK
ncbi:MAG: serine/threonine-protein kinase [Anaerolineales bacterium]